MNVDRELRRLHVDLKWKPLLRSWAKLEILLGLAGFLGGLLVAEAPGMISPTNSAAVVLGGALLSTLGGYLALAGHRSHLYQSNVKLAAYVIHRIVNQPDSEQPHSSTSHATDRPNLSGSHDC
jgi:hypothetical protein